MARQNIAQVFALVVGVTYILVGLVGFAATGFDGFTAEGPDKLIGFDLNMFHNIVHLVIGGLLLVVSRLSDPVIAQGALIGGGLVYLLAAVLGVVNALSILSIDDEFALDNFLHLFSGAAALAAGIAGARQSDSQGDRGGLAPREGPAY